MRRYIPLLVGLSLAALFAGLQVVFVLREGEVAVVTRFGRPHRTIGEAGLHRRYPWPVERVHRFDARLQVLEGALEETLTADGKNVLVSFFCGWRIADPLLFLERLGATEQAELSLDALLRTHKNSAIGRVTFGQLVNVDPSVLKHEALEQSVLEALKPEALKRYGIAVEFVGLRQIGLPEAILQSVFERMKAERKSLAEKYRSEGEAEATRIRARAESQRDELLAAAAAEARRLRAEGEAEAAAHYRLLAEDPELALFLRKLDALRETLGDTATLVIGSETEPFDLLLAPRRESPPPGP